MWGMGTSDGWPGRDGAQVGWTGGPDGQTVDKRGDWAKDYLGDNPGGLCRPTNPSKRRGLTMRLCSRAVRGALVFVVEQPRRLG